MVVGLGAFLLPFCLPFCLPLRGGSEVGAGRPFRFVVGESVGGDEGESVGRGVGGKEGGKDGGGCLLVGGGVGETVGATSAQQATRLKLLRILHMAGNTDNCHRLPPMLLTRLVPGQKVEVHTLVCSASH